MSDLKSSGGRNNHGRITVRHRGGGAKRKYRIIDFKRNKDGVPAKVATIEYDPNRSANIALLHYADGEKRYIIAPLGLNVGDADRIRTRMRISKSGNCLAHQKHPRRHHDPLASSLSPVKRRPAGCSSAGNAAQLMAKEGKYATGTSSQRRGAI